VQYVHAKGKKVIMWATSMINTDNPDFDMVVANKYAVRDKDGEARPIKWWKGHGVLLDYTNPAALKWWHGMMDTVLAALPDGDGIDGFKCDSTDPLIMEYMMGPRGKALGYNDVPYESYPQYVCVCVCACVCVCVNVCFSPCMCMSHLH
jgi:alpha-glucosidase (family GH31 glycosyl hydrolase)